MIDPEVLILVLVEHTLGVANKVVGPKDGSLNPCFSGTYPRRIAMKYISELESVS